MEKVKMARAGAKAAAPAEVTAEAEVPAKAEAATKPEVKPNPTDPITDDSISDLFSHEEEEVNPLVNLINSLPDVTAQELIDDLKE